jgi:hypothetical protein
VVIIPYKKKTDVALRQAQLFAARTPVDRPEACKAISSTVRAWMRKRQPDPCSGPRFCVRITWVLPVASRCPVRICPLAPPPPCRWPCSVVSHCRKRGMRTDLMVAQTSRMSLWQVEMLRLEAERLPRGEAPCSPAEEVASLDLTDASASVATSELPSALASALDSSSVSSRWDASAAPACTSASSASRAHPRWWPISTPSPPPCTGGPAPLLHRSSSSPPVLLLHASVAELLLPCHASWMRENTTGSALSSPVLADVRR